MSGKLKSVWVSAEDQTEFAWAAINLQGQKSAKGVMEEMLREGAARIRERRLKKEKKKNATS